MCRGGFQTGAMADGTIHVLDKAAVAANEVVVVVADPCFVERGRIGGFDAAHQSRIEQGVKIVIHGLPGKTTQALAGKGRNSVGIEMPAVVDRGQDGKPGRRDSHSHRPQFFLEHFRVRYHGMIMTSNLGFVKKKIVSRKIALL